MAIRFDASNDQLTSEGWSGNVVTIIVWWRIQADRDTYSNVWLVYPNSNGGGAVRAGLGSNIDGTTFTSFDSAFLTQAAGTPGVGNWYCTATVMNNTTWTTYHGTDPAGLTTVGPDTRTAFTDPGSVVLSLAAEWFSGDIAAYKVYTRALSGSEIADEAAAYVARSTTNLVRSHRWYNSTSLAPDEGSQSSSFTSGGGSVTLVAGPAILERTAGTVTGIASGEAFGSHTVSVPTAPQDVSPSGIASGAAFGSHVVTIGQTVAANGIASAAAIGVHQVIIYPTLVQAAQHFITSGALSKTAAFPSQTAVAGNLIVFLFVGNRNVGTLTLTGSNWHKTVDLRHDRLSLCIAWKIAAGGESGVSASWTSGNDAGSQCWVAEYSSGANGEWVVKGSASNNTTGVNLTSTDTGTSGTLAGAGVSLALFGVENVLSNSDDSVNNSYTLLFTQGTGSFESGIWVASRNLPGGVTTTTTLTRAAPVTADQMSGGLVVLGKAVVQAVTPTGIASGEVIGSLSILALYPTGIASSEAHGSHTVARTDFTIAPSGIATSQAFGLHVVHRGPLLGVTGIADTGGLGTPTVAYPTRDTYLGSNRMSAVYLGSDVVNAIYAGTTVVWD